MTIDKYSRHTILPEIGKNGQEKISRSKILLVGVGGIGSPLLLYLSLSGLAEIGVVDYDLVEESNLQRQVIFNQGDIGKNKAIAAKQNIEDFYQVSNIAAYPKKLTKELGEVLLPQFDVVVDATDDIKTKFLLNDLCLKSCKVFVSGAFIGWQGYYSVYRASLDRSLPCFACFHGDHLELNQERACYNQGVIAPGVGTIGTMMATEILKEICGAAKTLAGNLMLVDFLTNKHRSIKLQKREACCYCSSIPA